MPDRGEMHAVLDRLTAPERPGAQRIRERIDAVWSTWADVEASLARLRGDRRAPRRGSLSSTPMDAQAGAGLKACPCCGLVQLVGAVPAGSRAACSRCGVTVVSTLRRARSNTRAFAAALAALILYPLAISLPIMRLERFGHQHEASVWTGSVGLLAKGELLVGVVVLLCSVLIPLAKLVGLLLITGRPRWLSQRHQAHTYRWIEWTGRFGMLDVLLIAVVVAWIKVGDLVEVSPGPAALTFTLVVLLSLLASASFDPHALWEREAPQAGA